MEKTVFKSIVKGVFFGALIFFAGPFLLFVFLLKWIFTPFGMGRMAWMQHRYGTGNFMHGRPSLAFADKVRSMNDDEYTAFKDKMKEQFNGRCAY